MNKVSKTRIIDGKIVMFKKKSKKMLVVAGRREKKFATMLFYFPRLQPKVGRFGKAFVQKFK
jgi:hypothetical protein